MSGDPGDGPRSHQAKVAELVDALDSGSSEHCARGGSSPPFRTPCDNSRRVIVPASGLGCGLGSRCVSRSTLAARLLCAVMSYAALCCASVACQRDPAEELADQGMAHLEEAVAMVEAHAPNTVALASAAMHYRLKHREALETLRKQGPTRLAALTPEARLTFEQRYRSKAVPLQGRLEAAAKRYPNQALAMRLVRPLLVSPIRPGKVWRNGEPPWMPPLPEGITPGDAPAPSGGHGAHGHGGGHGHGGHGPGASELGAHGPGDRAPEQSAPAQPPPPAQAAPPAPPSP